MMLVGYSSSSEGEEDGEDLNRSSKLQKYQKDGSDDGCPVKKRPRTEEKLTKTRFIL